MILKRCYGAAYTPWKWAWSRRQGSISKEGPICILRCNRGLIFFLGLIKYVMDHIYYGLVKYA